MSTIVSRISEEGKIVYSKEGIESWKPVVQSCKGKEVYMTMISKDEVDYKKDLVKYYYDWILPFIAAPLRGKGCDTLRKSHLYVLTKFSPKLSIEDETYPTPFEDMTLSQRATFIAAVAVWGEKTYGIHFRASTEV